MSRRTTPQLVDFNTGRVLRPATAAEHAASQKAVAVDGIGLIQVDGRSCYTETDLCS